MRSLTGKVRYVPETTSRAKLLRVETSAQRPAVAILGPSGEAMQRKVGELSEDGTRCRLRFGGEWVDATREGNRWVYRPPQETDNDD